MTRWLLPMLFYGASAALAAGVGDEQTLSLLAQARARGCAGHAGTREPLQWSDALERAARRIDGGEAAATALEKERYRGKRIFHARFDGLRSAGDVARAFAQHYCAPLTDARFTEFGFHRSGSRWLFVLAEPLAIPHLADRRAALAEVLARTNQARSRPRHCGDKAFDSAPPLHRNAQLEQAAARHAQDMAAHAFLDHRGRDGSMPAQRITAAGYRWRAVGENVASGQFTPREVVDDWLRSPGHCANLMSADFTEMGLAFAVNMNAEAVVFWAQEFGRPR